MQMSRIEAQQIVERQGSWAIRKQPWWLILCWVVGGLGFDWICAFEWFSRRYSLFTEPVLGRTAVIAVWCAAVSLLVVWVVRQARWRDAAAIFFLASGEVWFFLTVMWVVHPTRWR